MKKKKYLIIELIILFIITLITNLTHNPITQDEIWNYGFAYNIATGLIPYKDFNMVITPLFPILGGIFLNIFGKSLLVYHIFNTIICTIIFYLLKKLIPKAYYLPYAYLLYYIAYPNYSLFCILLLFLLIYLEERNTNDYIIGIVLGLTFLTKQHVGIMLCIPTLFTKDIKKISKRILGFLIPNFILLIYLLTNNTLYNFIDYCFLGLSSFGKENLVISKWLYVTLISIIYLIYKYIKKKDIKLLYLLFFQILAYPLFDSYHCLICLVPTLYYPLSELKLNKKLIQIAFYIFITTLFTYNIILINKEEKHFQIENAIYQYRTLISKSTDTEIKIISNYLKQNKDKNIYIVNSHAYLYKLEANLPLTKYDLLNDGNIGKNGDQKIIKEWNKICKKEKCLFILDKDEINNNTLSQTNQNLITYVINNYQEKENITYLTIYTKK